MFSKYRWLNLIAVYTIALKKVGALCLKNDLRFQGLKQLRIWGTLPKLSLKNQRRLGDECHGVKDPLK
jgi:hypothetical protein